MLKSRILCGGSALAVTLALAAVAPAHAQQTPPAPAASEIDKCYAEAGDDEAKLAACDEKANAVTAVVSTGSRIRGLPEDAALPVEVLSRETLLERGSPTVLDLMRSLRRSHPWVSIVLTTGAKLEEPIPEGVTLMKKPYFLFEIERQIAVLRARKRH